MHEVVLQLLDNPPECESREPLFALAARDPCIDVLALEQALNELERRDPRKRELIALHYCGGLSYDEMARVRVLAPEAGIARRWSPARRTDCDGCASTVRACSPAAGRPEPALTLLDTAEAALPESLADAHPCRQVVRVMHAQALLP